VKKVCFCSPSILWLKYIKLKSIFREDRTIFGDSVLLVLLTGDHVDAEPVAEFNEPALGGLEGVGLAELHCKFSNLFLVS